MPYDDERAQFNTPIQGAKALERGGVTLWVRSVPALFVVLGVDAKHLKTCIPPPCYVLADEFGGPILLEMVIELQAQLLEVMAVISPVGKEAIL